MMLHHMLPYPQRIVLLPERRQRFRISHQGIAEVMFIILPAVLFQQRLPRGRTIHPQQTWAEMRPRVYVRRITLHRRPIAFFRLRKFSLLKINITQLKMMVGIVNVMDLGLELADMLPALRARQLKTARPRG